ncbi:MAG: alpha/beta fold hydrolase [Candidatus Binatia bacterium]|nr:alpha/beta fold hydrolase [Candidatus Binatia bacterium]
MLASRFLSAALLVTALFVVSCGDDATQGAPTEIALEDVREELRTLVDVSRPTTANGEFSGSPERRLETRLWYAERALAQPACRGRGCALILLAHGFGGHTERFDAIGQRLAAAGYIVAAVSFPLTNQEAPGGFTNAIGDAAQQPADLSFVLDALLDATRDPADSLYERIDSENVGAMGHSLGGATVIAASRTACCSDARIAATVYMEPVAFAVEALFGEPFTASGPATMTFQGQADFPVPVAESRAFHAALAGRKILVEMVGGNHINMIERFADEPDPLLSEAADMMIAFYDAYLVDGPNLVDQAAERLRGSGHTVRIEG